jgi:antitoxin (DNA-binding transcriptional repressor) of toxin-antitoxin stability system
MSTIRAEDVRIPRWVREAIAKGEQVVVVNRERPAFVIVHPDEAPRRGRPLSAALATLARVAGPDPAFAEDLAAVLADAPAAPPDPWERF